MEAPIAYFLTNKLPAATQGNLLKQCIVAMHDTGYDVSCITFDGLSANVSMAKQFGCRFEPGDMYPFFPHPVDSGKEIAVMFDACHMLKLLRNVFEVESVLSIPNVGYAQFEHLQLLHNVQETEGLRAGNKLTVRHVKFHQQRMKVKLAAQLFSDSVSKALALAQTLNIAGFEDCHATQHLCSVVNNLFDILNSKSVFGTGYKAPLSLGNIEQVKPFLLETRDMLLHLRTGTGKLVCRSRSYLSVVGFASNITCVLKLSEFLLHKVIGGKPIDYILRTNSRRITWKCCLLVSDAVWVAAIIQV